MSERPDIQIIAEALGDDGDAHDALLRVSTRLAAAERERDALLDAANKATLVYAQGNGRIEPTMERLGVIVAAALTTPEGKAEGCPTCNSSDRADPWLEDHSHFPQGRRCRDTWHERKAER